MDLAVLQTLVRRWCVRAFGQEVADSHRERNHRFLEEALELCQSLGCSQEDAHVLVDYVYGRPQGQPGQEVGGVMITLAALCGAHTHLSMDVEARSELARINRPEVLEKIRGKQAAKQREIPTSPLPGQVACAVYQRPAGVMGGPCCNCGMSQPEHVRPETRTHTDAVGTTGGKATVARKT